MKKKQSGSKSRFEGFFKIRKETPKPGRIIESKRDKEKEKRIKHRDLIGEVEEN